MSDPIQSEPFAANSAAPHTSVAGRIRNYFLTGLVVAGPVLVTLYLTWSFINWVDNVVRPFIPPVYRPETYLPWPIPGTGLVIAFVVLTFLGFLTANFVGAKLLDFGESLLNRMPIVRPIYKTMKQVFETLFSKTGSGFRQVALVEFPGPGMWSLILISQPPIADISAKLPQGEHVSAFLPCSPNPTTGFFFYVQRKDIVALDITVESAMAMLFSIGMAQPGNDPQKQLASLAATAKAAQSARDTAVVK
jgi:uncharacterized membrane protein